MRIVQTAVAAVLMGLVLHAQVPSPVTPTTQQPGPPVAQPAPPAGQPVPQAPVPGAPPVPTPILPPVPATPVLARSFTAKAGLLFNAVRPERVLDFETVIGLLQDALEKSTDPAVRAQANGWHVFKATEPGPNGTVMYVFVVDPAIAGADYGLGRILSEAYPDRIMEIWKLYTGALAGGGSLLNLSPVVPPPPTAATPTITEPATVIPGGRGAPAGRGAVPPAGRGAAPPAGRGATLPAGRGAAPTRPAPPQ
ncbi:MAG: hypothetical protein Q7J25_09280, partial [Vicinamibacterales bacterium]|nr:hypothetical protein [Vicinamibacterales bacterium]